jgi:hypothetical protein
VRALRAHKTVEGMQSPDFGVAPSQVRVVIADAEGATHVTDLW